METQICSGHRRKLHILHQWPVTNVAIHRSPFWFWSLRWYVWLGHAVPNLWCPKSVCDQWLLLAQLHSGKQLQRGRSCSLRQLRDQHEPTVPCWGQYRSTIDTRNGVRSVLLCRRWLECPGNLTKSCKIPLIFTPHFLYNILMPLESFEDILPQIFIVSPVWPFATFAHQSSPFPTFQKEDL